MLVTLVENHTIKKKLINDFKTNVTFEFIEFNKIDRDIYINLKDGYYIEEDTKSFKITKNTYFLKHDQLFYDVELIISLNINSYNFKKFDYQDKLVISNKGKCDILLNYGLKKYLLIIKNYKIITNINCFVNGCKYQGQSLKINDCIDTLCFRIIILDDYYLISETYVSLNNIFSKPKFIDCVKRENNQYKYSFIPELKIPVWKFKIKDFDLSKFHNKITTSFISLGQSLTMAFVSIAIGVLNTYNALNKGRSLEEVMTMLILPVSMFLSIIIWFSINKYSQNKQNKNNIKLEINNYRNYLKKLSNRLNKYLIDYNRALNSVSLTHDDISEIMQNGKLSFCHKTDSRLLRILLGTKKLDKDYFKLNKPKIDDTKLKEELDVILNDFYHQVCVCELNLGLFSDITINIQNDDSLFKYIYAQLSFKTNKQDLIFISYIEEKYLKKYDFILSDLHFIHDQKRHVYTKPTFIELDNDRPKIVWVFNEDYILNRIDNAIYLYIYYDETINPATKCLIKCRNKIASIKYDDVEYTFYYHDFKLKITNLIQRINLINTKVDLNKNILCEIDYWFEKYQPKPNSLTSFVGYDNAGQPILIDLASDKGCHLLVAGCSGSGKSMFLLSYCLSLCFNYSPEYLNLVIIDYKGEGLLSYFKTNTYILSHLVSSLNNIENIDYEKIIYSFKLERFKRQKLFKELSMISNHAIGDLKDYHRFYHPKYKLPKLAHLVIVIDEFAELKAQFSDFINEIVSIARIGRSLGIHLVLATQKPAGVIDEQIKTNINYRICLKVAQKNDSIEMLDQDCAYYLVNPGQFYLFNNNYLLKGKGIYLGQDIYHGDKQKCSLLNYDLSIKQELFNKIQQYKNKASDILEKIQIKYQHIKKGQALWLDRITDIEFNSILSIMTNNKDSIYVGQLDDFYTRKQYPLALKCKENTVVIAKDSELINRLIYILLINFNLIVDNFEVVLINSKRMDVDIFKNTSLFNNIISEKEEIDYLFYLCMNKVFKNSMVIIINDLQSFYNLDEDYLEKLKHLLNLSVNKNFKMIIISNMTSNLNYKSYHLISQKLILGNIDNDEIIFLFNQKTQLKANKNEGIYLKDKPIKFTLFSLNNIKLDNSKDICNLNFKFLKPELKIKEDKLYLGLDSQNYTMIFHDLNKKIVVISSDIALQTKIKELSHNHQNIFFASNVIENSNHSLLCLDHKQYYINYKQYHITQNQALYVDNMVVRKIIYAR